MHSSVAIVFFLCYTPGRLGLWNACELNSKTGDGYYRVGQPGSLQTRSERKLMYAVNNPDKRLCSDINRHGRKKCSRHICRLSAMILWMVVITLWGRRYNLGHHSGGWSVTPHLIGGISAVFVADDSRERKLWRGLWTCYSLAFGVRQENRGPIGFGLKLLRANESQTLKPQFIRSTYSLRLAGVSFEDQQMWSGLSIYRRNSPAVTVSG